jgi:hypothetical protein
MDVKNTLEVFEALISVSKKLKPIMADGKVSLAEGFELAYTQSSVVIAAIDSSNLISAELSDLSQDEIARLAAKGIELAQAVMALVSK